MMQENCDKQNNKKKKFALISVSDKTDVADMSRCLVELGYEIISTGGTATALKEADVPVTHVSDITGFPEIMNGRVKTLHPKIHGGILGMRDNDTHVQVAKENGIKWIDIVIVNLYPFEETIKKSNVTIEDAIENIDIGGPSMVRSAAKNHKFVTVMVDPSDYRKILEEINIKGEASLLTRQRLAAKAFAHTAAYDSTIDSFLSKKFLKKSKLHLTYEDGNRLRYGENPHQSAKFYKTETEEATLANAKQLHGKELSYNNLVDGNAALEAVKDIRVSKGVVVVKHTNPCGFATGKTLDKAFEAAWNGDPVSAFGSVIAVNSSVDIKTARCLQGRFIEILMAPDFKPDALEFLKKKSKDIRLLKLKPLKTKDHIRTVYRTIMGGMLEQKRDSLLIKTFTPVTKADFPESKQKLARFAYRACKHVKSNAIILAFEYTPGFYMVLGMGAGQPNRVDSIRKLCATKAADNIKLLHEKEKPEMPLEEFQKKIFGESVLASDAFFPFDDNIEYANEFGVKYIVEPGGSKRDGDVISTCDKYGISMIFTGIRHFNH